MSRPADRRKSLEHELDAEIHAHLEMAIETRLDSGIPREEAERLALEEFGDVERVKRCVIQG